MDKEKLIAQIMKECEADGEPITREEAEEMAEMEIKAKGIKNYVQSETEKKPKKPRERKVDEEKAKLLEILASGLDDFEIPYTTENETKLHFTYNKAEYSVTLTKHRPPKK